MPALQDIRDALVRLSPFVLQTPTVFSAALSERFQAKIYLKLENLQRTGSFKERGALNRLLLLSPEQKALGVVTASAGNHAQGVAYHATRLQIASTVFMPLHASVMKIKRTQHYGARALLVGDSFDDAHAAAQQFALETGSFYLHAFDDDAVIAGQGTIGLELLSQVPDLDVVIVPVGGGGLMSGVAIAMHGERPKVQMIGVEPEVLPSMAEAIRARHVVTLPAAHTIADGIATRAVAASTLDICAKHVAIWATVNDEEVMRAIVYLLEEQKIVAEGAGAAGVAALLAEKIGTLAGKTVAIVISGGNIDRGKLCKA